MRDLAKFTTLPSSATPTLNLMNAIATAGGSVRQKASGFFGDASLCAGCALVLLSVGLVVSQLGAPELGGLLVVVGILFAWEARQKWRLGTRFRIGAIAEERVGSRLWKLEELGWLIEHDVPKGHGGNVDHVVQSPAVTFVVETKAGQGKLRDLDQARRHAEWASQRFGGGRTVIPILCLQRSKQDPEEVRGVYRVSASHLVDFMLDRG